ncbi:MAG: hypothetical protein DMG07_06615 [Acidobacteria bacterium]|nr:MAG: hypothetical protein DMG07_06615 [Acidobacteriota bacterium]
MRVCPKCKTEYGDERATPADEPSIRGCASSVNALRRTMELKLRFSETLLWVGQPEPRLFSREMARAYLFFLGLLALFSMVSYWLIPRLSQSRMVVIPAILVVSVMISYFLITAPWRYRRRILQTIYAITDRRALVYRGFGWSSLWLEALPDLHDMLWSFDASQIRARRRIARYQGRTDLVFDGERHYHMTGRGQIRDWVQVGFLGLANVDEVDRLLEAQFAPHADISGSGSFGSQ